ncbi:MAG TPA: nucleoside monophosphate kinase [Candidatus Nanoarchaeia archaeon]|nr:adenylate kinase [uncultured archaeon]
MIILVFGSQGSGKTTHAHYIANKLGLPYVSTGEILRKIQEEPTELGRKVKDLISKGFIVPDDITVDAFKKYLDDNQIKDSFVLEGFPRTTSQVELVPYPVSMVFEFVLGEKTAVERLHKRGRHDDSLEIIHQRLKLFKEKTLPVIEYYKKSGIPIFVVSNEPPIEEVQKEIDELLKKQTGN